MNRAHWAVPSNAPFLGLRISMELRVLFLLPLCFPGLQGQSSDAEESRSEGSTLYIQCPYPASLPQYSLEKAWCLRGSTECKFLVRTTSEMPYSSTKRAKRGEITLQDNHIYRTMYITMTNLQVEDSGMYSCVYGTSYHGYYWLKTISLNVFKELHMLELDSLSVQCPYSNSVYSTDTKVWCQRVETECDIIVKTYPSTQRTSKSQGGKTLIQDDTQQHMITITMEKLQAQSTGVYWCALYIEPLPTRIMEVRLSVSKRTKEYTAGESGDVSVHCLYNTSYYGAVSKAWCKEETSESCAILVTTNRKPPKRLRTAQQDRVRIQDDTQLGIITVTMEKLQAQDSGVYWCALHEYNRLYRMVEVTLSISEVSSGTNLSSTTGTSQTTPSGITPELSSNVNTFILLSGILSSLFIVGLIISITLCVRRRKQLKRRGNSQAEDTYEKPEDITAQLDSPETMKSHQDDSSDVKYVTLNFKSQLIPEDPLYCNVEPNQADGQSKDENVEYAVIALKQLPTNDKG